MLTKRCSAGMILASLAVLASCVAGCGYYIPMRPGDITAGLEDVINGPPITTFDGRWLSETYADAMDITSHVGRVIISNTPVLHPGDIIMVIETSDGPSFTARHIFSNGAIRNVVGFLLDPNTLVMSDGSITWRLIRVISNAPPVVDAGPNASIFLPINHVDLSGTVSDDGWPNGTLTTTWSVASGPAGAVFADASATATTVTFSQAGTYVLRLEASDGELTSSDTLTVFVH
jgi:hypothetical protein